MKEDKHTQIHCKIPFVWSRIVKTSDKSESSCFWERDREYTGKRHKGILWEYGHIPDLVLGVGYVAYATVKTNWTLKIYCI